VDIEVARTRDDGGRAAAALGAERIRRALEERGDAAIIVATGSSQFEMLEHLVAAPAIDWGRIAGFHLDEYVGLSEDHPASFRRYLRERFVERLPRPIGAFHYIQGDADPVSECRRLADLIRPVDVDVAFVGIGENGHLAFNDPPTDLQTTVPYLVVSLDEGCRRQQLGEGWFPTLEDVPARAISMSVRQILRSRTIVCTVPDERKAVAVRDAVEGPVTEQVPASALQLHEDCHLFLDGPAASLLARGGGR
jgi:glucosamine-6-phosphate deaminase